MTELFRTRTRWHQSIPRLRNCMENTATISQIDVTGSSPIFVVATERGAAVGTRVDLAARMSKCMPTGDFRGSGIPANRQGSDRSCFALAESM